MKEALPNTIYKASIILTLKPNENDYWSVFLRTQIFNKKFKQNRKLITQMS